MNDRQRNTMLISFGISVLFFWMLLGSVYMALGFLALLFIHEMGHFIAAKQVNLRVTPPVFTPFGAFIGMLEQPASAREEAYMAYGGPFLGTIGAIGSLVLGVVLGVPQLVILAKYAFYLNLFNLIPLAPLDGGRISMAIHRKMWVLGIVAFGFLIYSMGLGLLMNPFNLFIFGWIGMQAWQDIKSRETQYSDDYFDVGAGTRIGYLIAYLALGAFLFYGVTNIDGLVHLLVSLGL